MGKQRFINGRLSSEDETDEMAITVVEWDENAVTKEIPVEATNALRIASCARVEFQRVMQSERIRKC